MRWGWNSWLGCGRTCNDRRHPDALGLPALERCDQPAREVQQRGLGRWPAVDQHDLRVREGAWSAQGGGRGRPGERGPRVALHAGQNKVGSRVAKRCVCVCVLWLGGGSCEGCLTTSGTLWAREMLAAMLISASCSPGSVSDARSTPSPSVVPVPAQSVQTRRR